MKAYLVGVHCQYEGSGWDEVVLDNENLIPNIKAIVNNYLDRGLGTSLKDIEDSYFEDEWDIIQEQIGEVNRCKKALTLTNKLEDFKNLGVLGSQVVTITKVNIYE